MSTRLRTSIGNRISFFSFQDIITCVTGILILVTLILTLYLQQAVPVTSEHESLRQRLASLLNEVTRVTLRNEQRQSSLQLLATAPDPERLQAEITQWEKQLNAQSNRLAALAEVVTEREQAAAQHAERLGLSDLRERFGTVQKQVEARQSTNAALATDARALETLQKELQAKIEAITNQHRIWILPETTRSARKPVLVTVSGAKLVCDRFNQPGERKEFGAAQAAQAFAATLRLWHPDKDYLVFYVRPSGISLFSRCLELSKQAGFQVGYDAVEEDKEILFSQPASP